VPERCITGRVIAGEGQRAAHDEQTHDIRNRYLLGQGVLRVIAILEDIGRGVERDGFRFVVECREEVGQHLAPRAGFDHAQPGLAEEAAIALAHVCDGLGDRRRRQRICGRRRCIFCGEARWLCGGRCRARLAAQTDVELHALILDGYQVLMRFEERAELLIAVVGLVERGIQPQHDLLQPAGEHRRLTLLFCSQQCAVEQVAWVGQLQLVGDIADFFCDERLIEDELVARAAQQIARGRVQADADGVLAVVAQLVDQLGEVAVAGDDGKNIDLGAGEHRLHRVDGQAHIGPVLVLHAHGIKLEQVDAVLQHGAAVAVKASPVAVSSLDEQPPA